jgi:hypothetical protein
VLFQHYNETLAESKLNVLVAIVYKLVSFVYDTIAIGYQPYQFLTEANHTAVVCTIIPSPLLLPMYAARVLILLQ